MPRDGSDTVGTDIATEDPTTARFDDGDAVEIQTDNAAGQDKPDPNKVAQGDACYLTDDKKIRVDFDPETDLGEDAVQDDDMIVKIIMDQVMYTREPKSQTPAQVIAQTIAERTGAIKCGYDVQVSGTQTLIQTIEQGMREVASGAEDAGGNSQDIFTDIDPDSYFEQLSQITDESLNDTLLSLTTQARAENEAEVGAENADAKEDHEQHSPSDQQTSNPDNLGTDSTGETPMEAQKQTQMTGEESSGINGALTKEALELRFNQIANDVITKRNDTFSELAPLKRHFNRRGRGLWYGQLSTFVLGVLFAGAELAAFFNTMVQDATGIDGIVSFLTEATSSATEAISVLGPIGLGAVAILGGMFAIKEGWKARSTMSGIGGMLLGLGLVTGVALAFPMMAGATGLSFGLTSLALPMLAIATATLLNFSSHYANMRGLKDMNDRQYRTYQKKSQKAQKKGRKTTLSLPDYESEFLTPLARKITGQSILGGIDEDINNIIESDFGGNPPSDVMRNFKAARDAVETNLSSRNFNISKERRVLSRNIVTVSDLNSILPGRALK